MFAAAQAATLPDGVAAMLRTADPGQLPVVAAVAKKAHPAAAGEIDALVATLGARRAAAAPPPPRWKGEWSLGGTLTTGNTSQRGVSASASLVRQGEVWRHSLETRADLQRSTGVDTRERYLVGYQPNVTVAKGVFAYARLQWERDRFAGFDRRFTESLGIGWLALDDERLRLSFEGGPALRQTRFAADREEAEFGGRGKLEFRWTVNARLKLTQDAGFVIGNDSDTIFASSALTAGLFGDLSTRLSFDVLHETNPPPGRERTDTTTRVGVVYSF